MARRARDWGDPRLFGPAAKGRVSWADELVFALAVGLMAAAAVCVLLSITKY